jgi:CheY-like chemotaxis protein
MKKILIVDDEGLFLELAQHILEQAGHECRTAGNGNEALGVIANGFMPDLVVTDVNMPILNGLGLAHQLRAKGINVPIIFTTGGLGHINLVQLQEFSIHLLNKPFRSEDLKTMVEYAIMNAKLVGK